MPAIRLTEDTGDREADLRSYVETYLEEEVRQEALVRNVGAYGRFLELAAREAGRVEPVTRSASRKKLTKASRSLLFDTGVARAAAREGRRLPLSRRGELFAQFIGIEVIRFCRLHAPRPLRLTRMVTAVPWQDLPGALASALRD